MLWLEKIFQFRELVVMKFIYKISTLLLSVLLCAGLVSCQKETIGDGCEGSGRPVDLKIALNAPVNVSSRTLADGNYDNLEDGEKLIDGRVFQRLTIFIINKATGKSVAYRDISNATSSFGGAIDAQKPGNTFINSNTEAEFTFMNGEPFRTDEILSEGNYRIVAVANWDVDVAYSSTIAELKKPIGEQSSTAVSNLLNLTTSATTGHICPKNMMPLTAIKDVYLRPGPMNQISMELVRTRARLRIVIENMSSNTDIKVNSLNVNGIFRRTKTKLFDNPDHPGSIYEGNYDGQGSGVSHSDQAIVQFAPVTLKAVNNSANVSERRKVVFDGYLLEAKRPLNSEGKSIFKYSIGFEYGGSEIPTNDFTLSTFDPYYTRREETEIIKRNDFIDLYITVKHIPESGTIDFIVSRWVDRVGNIEYQ